MGRRSQKNRTAYRLHPVYWLRVAMALGFAVWTGVLGAQGLGDSQPELRLLLVCSLGCLVAAAWMGRMMFFQVVASRDGLEVIEPGSRRFFDWDELSKIASERYGSRNAYVEYRVRTKGGRSFTFRDDHISGASALASRIQGKIRAHREPIVPHQEKPRA